ncbi:MAG: hypothetical protein PVH61_29305 [Candidatus Aminicenantes bacterium]|jgi:hypothetical protein
MKTLTTLTPGRAFFLSVFCLLVFAINPIHGVGQAKTKNSDTNIEKKQQRQTEIGIYQISISANADREAFEEFMKTEVFPKVNVGRQTRGGIVTAQYLLKSETPGSKHDYSWIIRWKNQGGSVFGSAGVPFDPATQLSAFGAKTSFTRCILKAEELQ